jgi:hypothetical protein
MIKRNVWLQRLGTAVVVLGMLALSGLVWWNRCGAGPYRDNCNYSIGCRSYLCLRHSFEPATSQQIRSAGQCTKACTTDKDCTAPDRCVELTNDARDDLPPFGKPTRACMAVR